MANLASFWVGDSLGVVEQISAKSFLRQGDHLTIYTHGPLANVPDGVEIRDANEILKTEKIIRHKKTGSPALHSDLFRYALMEKTDAIWVDLDVLALKPFDFKDQWIFGYEAENFVNGAVLRFPQNSQTLKELLKMHMDVRGVPPHLEGFKKWKYQLRSWLKGGLTIDQWPWGSIGPAAITHFLQQTGEIKHTLPMSAFYAVPLAQVERFVQPGALQDSDIPDDAWALHLWGRDLRKVLIEKYEDRIPEGCFLSNFLEN